MRYYSRSVGIGGGASFEANDPQREHRNCFGPARTNRYGPLSKDPIPAPHEISEDLHKKVISKEYDPPLPKSPTPERPGSEEKIRIMCERLEAGEALFHPLDFDLFDKKFEDYLRELEGLL